MKINIEMIVIDRYNYPSDSSMDKHIKSITKLKIGCFETDIVPRRQEIIKFESINYVVSEVIRTIDTLGENFTVQVVRHNPLKTKCYGSNSWSENIPLCIDIE